MNGLIDRETYGRLAKAARIIAGFKSVKEACEAFEGLGVPLSARRLYALEAGKDLPSVEEWAVLTLTYSPPEGLLYFWRAFTEDARERLNAIGIESQDFPDTREH